MDRRSFLKRLGLLGAAVVIAPKVAIEAIGSLRRDGNPIFTGQLGQWNGIILHRPKSIGFTELDSATVKRWADASRHEAAQGSYFKSFIGPTDSHFIQTVYKP